MSTNHELRAIHDRLLEVMPEGAEHEAGSCPLCVAMDAIDHDRTPGGVMPETFTQDELDAAIAAASGPLQQRLAELEAQVKETEVGRAVAEVSAAKETEISDLQTQLDAATVARTAAETALAETQQYWADAIAAHEQAAEIAARKDERTAKAKELGVFTEDYVVSNADRFAAMSDEDFAARIEEWRLIAKREVPVGAAVSKIPAQTALAASRADAHTAPGSALGRLAEWRARGVDPRTLGGAQ